MSDLFPWPTAWWRGSGISQSGSTMTCDVSSSGIGVTATLSAPVTTSAAFVMRVTHSGLPAGQHLGWQFTRYTGLAGSGGLGDTWGGLLTLSDGTQGQVTEDLIVRLSGVEGAARSWRPTITLRTQGLQLHRVNIRPAVEVVQPGGSTAMLPASLWDGAAEVAIAEITATP